MNVSTTMFCSFHSINKTDPISGGEIDPVHEKSSEQPQYLDCHPVPLSNTAPFPVVLRSVQSSFNDICLQRCSLVQFFRQRPNRGLTSRIRGANHNAGASSTVEGLLVWPRGHCVTSIPIGYDDPVLGQDLLVCC